MIATRPEEPRAEDLQRCAELRKEELEVIESIYPEYISKDAAAGIKFEIPVELAEPAYIKEDIPPAVSSVPADNGPTSRSQDATASLSSLPPLLLEIILPPLYPLHSAPMIASVHATHSWLPVNARFLQHRMMEFWTEGEGVLYTWIEWIRTGEFLETLNLTSQTDGLKYIKMPHQALHLLMPLLIAYDLAIQESRFSEAAYSCEICMTSIRGARCIRLSCSHIFCRSCLEDFWKLCIQEGDIERVVCPDPGCVKEGKEASEEEVRRVVTEGDVQRWKWLRQKRLFEKDPTVTYCPIAFCQTPVPKPSNVEEDSGWDRLRTCPQCDFSFCAYCRRTWHGPVADCPMSSTETFVLEYLALPEGSSGRGVIELRYGKANVRRLLAKYQEDQANKQLIDSSTTACPSCRVKVEKSMGCNHMTCVKCKQHFCYRCGEKLSASDPYRHFSTPGLSCYSKLFDQESIDNEWQPIQEFDFP